MTSTVSRFGATQARRALWITLVVVTAFVVTFVAHPPTSSAGASEVLLTTEASNP